MLPSVVRQQPVALSPRQNAYGRTRYHAGDRHCRERASRRGLMSSSESAQQRTRNIGAERVVRRTVRRPLESIWRSEEHTSELQSPYVISYAVFCLKKK